MSFATQYSLSQDITFRTRVEIAMITSAINIQAEAPTAENDTNRSNYAKLVLNNPTAYTPWFAEAVVTQNDPGTTAPMTSAITDANLKSVVDSVWNALAGRI